MPIPAFGGEAKIRRGRMNWRIYGDCIPRESLWDWSHLGGGCSALPILSCTFYFILCVRQNLYFVWGKNREGTRRGIRNTCNFGVIAGIALGIDGGDGIGEPHG